MRLPRKKKKALRRNLLRYCGNSKIIFGGSALIKGVIINSEVGESPVIQSHLIENK